MLKPQDCVVLLKLIANPKVKWSQRELGESLLISPGEINKSISRLVAANLLRQDKKNRQHTLPILNAATEFFVHGVKYVFPVKLGEYTPGVATGVAAPIFSGKIVLGNDPVPVWPYGKGNIKGLALQPLYPTIPQALQDYPDQNFYDLLALLDAIRQGRARERNFAIELLTKKIDDAS